MERREKAEYRRKCLYIKHATTINSSCAVFCFWCFFFLKKRKPAIICYLEAGFLLACLFTGVFHHHFHVMHADRSQFCGFLSEP